MSAIVPSCAAAPAPSRETQFLSAVISAVPHLSVNLLSQLAMCIIDAIDDASQDADIEEDDPSGDPTDEFGEEFCHISAVSPRYGADQALGPINHLAALPVSEVRYVRAQ